MFIKIVKNNLQRNQWNFFSFEFMYSLYLLCQASEKRLNSFVYKYIYYIYE